jgi:hypothetical protein
LSLLIYAIWYILPSVCIFFPFSKEGILCYAISHVLREKPVGNGKHEQWLLNRQLAMMVDMNINIETYSK